MILPHHIDLAQSQKYDLSIRLTPNGFSFSIFSSTNRSIFFFKDIDFNNNLSFVENVKKIFFEVNLFTQHYRKIHVTVVSPFYTLVPKQFFETANAVDFFSFNINNNQEQVLHNQSQPDSFHLVYNLNKELYSFLHRNLWNPTFTLFTNHLVDFFKTYRSDTTSKRCFADFHDNMITIICFDAEQLLSANTFEVKDTFDALYNLVNIWEKLPLNQNRDLLFLSGSLNEHTESINILKQLIRHVEKVEINNKAQHLNYTQPLPTDILLKLCE